MFQVNENTRPGRMLAQGRLTVTFLSPSGTHLTVTAKARKAPESEGARWTRSNLAEASVVFFEVPNASGGWNDRIAKFTRARGFVPQPGADPARIWAAKQLVRYARGEVLPAGLVAYEECSCGRCGRALTDPVSIERGIGPECYGLITGSQHERRDGAETICTAEQRRERNAARIARRQERAARAREQARAARLIGGHEGERIAEGLDRLAAILAENAKSELPEDAELLAGELVG